MKTNLLEIEDLKVSFPIHGGIIQAVRGVTFHLKQGETLALVGESGCGKSTVARAIMGLIPGKGGGGIQGSIRFAGQELVGLNVKELRQIRGRKIAMISQDPMTSLDPTMKIGKQVVAGYARSKRLRKSEEREKAVELLEMVGIPDPRRRIGQYPHQFSGGMRQRALIAAALASGPQLLIADEPTTALDVTIQAQILELLKQLQVEQRLSVLLITHDLGIVAQIAHRVAVMYAGKIVETARVTDLFARPKHPYTYGLLQSIPRIEDTVKRRLTPIEGSPPDLLSPPSGCPFTPRCPYAMNICAQQHPLMTSFANGQQAACWLHDPRAPRVERFVAAGRETE
ncbi:ABC transporter ATP-binding protein [Brevibacillus marinus]|uniref:ABC transporter ATP-binding protein n=1 Tax=Brevibacillus marinus TaxID=2496837 RepID=UPI001F49C260|nr:ABC transporter ATP-binding protein [Brevibacillus marinus]